MKTTLGCLAAALLAAGAALAEPASKEGDYFAHDFRFRSGETLPELRIHYTTLGAPNRDAKGHVTNAVLIMHGTGGAGISSSGRNSPACCSAPAGCWTRAILHRPARRHRPREIVQAERRAACAIPALRLRRHGRGRARAGGRGAQGRSPALVMGTSMGCMHSFVWGEAYPDFMDALMPLACLPVQIAGRNRVWRKMLIDGITKIRPGTAANTRPSRRWACASPRTSASSPAGRRCRCRSGCRPAMRPTRTSTSTSRKTMATQDANDLLYAVDSSRNYDPVAKLDKIKAPVMWVNSADDFINPPELGIAEARGEEDPARQVRADPREPPDPRPRHAHLGGRVEGSSGGAAEGVGEGDEVVVDREN